MHKGQPIIFGEVLFDHFPDQARLGGAPFNVAWHLQGFGLETFFISRVGEEIEGEEVLEKMSAWGMNTKGVQKDPAHPTGQVLIEMQGDKHTFDIRDRQAYDYIDFKQAKDFLPQDPSILYHGSLALRNEVSRSTLSQLKTELKAPTFVDINVRHPWWDTPISSLTLSGDTWTKLSEEELRLLMPGSEAIVHKAESLRQRLGCEKLFLTRGENGSALITNSCVIEKQPTTRVAVADTVGAGDAFAAVAIFGLLNNWSDEDILTRAMQFAEMICGVNGALLEDKTKYKELLRKWSD